MNISRRSFLGGIGATIAALVTAKVPVPDVVEVDEVVAIDEGIDVLPSCDDEYDLRHVTVVIGGWC